jgi:hypothetical protein
MLASVGKGHYDAAFDTGTNICPTPFNPRLASVLFYPLLLELKKSALCSNDPISACPCRKNFSLPYTGFWFINCGPCGCPLLVHIFILLVRSFSVGASPLFWSQGK